MHGGRTDRTERRNRKVGYNWGKKIYVSRNMKAKKLAGIKVLYDIINHLHMTEIYITVNII